MPELPEVEAIVRKLRRSAKGARIRGFRVLRPRATHPQHPATLEECIGRTIRSVERRGKNIVMTLDGGLALRVHLRMTGNLQVIPDARFHSSTVRAMLEFDDGRGLVLDDPRLLGSMNLFKEAELEAKLQDVGVDPTTSAFTPEFLMEAVRKSRRPAKLFLMDQWPVAGLGNIYAAESLFRARIHPMTPVGRLRGKRVRALHAAIVEVLNEAIPAAVRSYREPGDHDGMDYEVYGREGEPCHTCSRTIERIAQGGRSTYFCPRCQAR